VQHTSTNVLACSVSTRFGHFVVPRGVLRLTTGVPKKTSVSMTSAASCSSRNNSSYPNNLRGLVFDFFIGFFHLCKYEQQHIVVQLLH
jgi:hypothetical protein